MRWADGGTGVKNTERTNNMQGAIQIANDMRAAVQTRRLEGQLTLTQANTATGLTSDPTIYFQKLWVYPSSGTGYGTGGLQLAPNAAAVHVGNTSTLIASVSLTGLGIAGNTGDAPSLLVTATCLVNPFTTGDLVRISGASDGAYNGTFQVTTVNSTTFTYMLADPPASLAPSGTLVAAGVTAAATDLPLKYELPLGQKQLLASVQVAGAINDGVYWRVW